jgi:hypothetical protein
VGGVSSRIQLMSGRRVENLNWALRLNGVRPLTALNGPLGYLKYTADLALNHL